MHNHAETGKQSRAKPRNIRQNIDQNLPNVARCRFALSYQPNMTQPAQPGLPSDRQTYIRQRLQQDGRVVAAELAQTLGVSEDSIRRDLRELASSGICQRVYGGAIAMTPNTGNFSQRSHENIARKARLAATAVQLLRPGQFVFLDSGTTNLEIARAIPDGLALTIATNAIPIAAALLGRSALEVLVVGGRMDHRIGGTMGSSAMLEIQTLRPDICFLGTCSLDIELGVGTTLSEEAALKRELVRHSSQVVLCVTNEKLDTASPFSVAAMADIGQLVLEADAEPHKLQRLRDCGVPVLLAKA